jgi:hypothetical protein
MVKNQNMETMNKVNNSFSTKFNRALYGLFIVLAIYQAVFSKDFISAASNLGIALIFDPFDQTMPWNKRPTWQKAWLIVHLAIAAGCLGFGIGLNDGIV